MQGGDFVILAGAPGMGKTCMMINLAASIANLGFKVDVFSLEMTLKQLQNRLICPRQELMPRTLEHGLLLITKKEYMRNTSKKNCLICL